MDLKKSYHYNSILEYIENHEAFLRNFFNGDFKERVYDSLVEVLDDMVASGVFERDPPLVSEESSKLGVDLNLAYYDKLSDGCFLYLPTAEGWALLDAYRRELNSKKEENKELSVLVSTP